MELTNYLKIKKTLPNNVKLLAVSKGFGVNEIRRINNLGQNDFGESRFQEANEKQILLKNFHKIKWHFIGRIQTNKIRKIVQSFDYIHSVDSYQKLLKISNISIEEKKNPSIMIQVKLSDDPDKGGMNPKELIERWEYIKQIKNLEIKGLMTINPKGLSSNENLKLFKKCRSLANSLKLNECSMGMSGDWEEAVEAGTTWLRLGSLLFGDRKNLVNV